MTPHRIITEAQGAGLADLGLTDHPFHDGLPRFHAALRHTLNLRDTGSLRVWIGAELEVIGPERLIIPPARLPDADYLIAAPSHYDIEHFPPVQNLQDPVEWADRLLRDMENVIGSGAHAIAHPFYVIEFVRPSGRRWGLPPLTQVFAEMRPRRLDNLLDGLIEAGIALEISPKMCSEPALQDFLENWYREALRRGMKFLLGSDSHRPHTIGKLRAAEEVVRRLGLRESDLWHPRMIPARKANPFRPMAASGSERKSAPGAP